LPNPFDDGYVPEDNSDEADTDFEPDVATVAFLDQQQAEFGNMEDDFAATYGFTHECYCGEDYAAGRVGEITQCYHNMMQEALANCARLNAELKEVTAIAQALFFELQKRDGDDTLKDEPSSDESDEQAVESETEKAAADGAGEGLGATPIEPGNTNEEGSPGDRKLV
jgi:hypothetical protein